MKFGWDLCGWMRMRVLRGSRGGAKAVSKLFVLPFEGWNLECLPMEIIHKWSLGSPYHGCHSITCLLLNSHFECFDLGEKVFLSSSEVNRKYSLGCLFELYMYTHYGITRMYNIWFETFFSTVMNEIWANLPVCVLILPHSLWDLKASSISTELCFFSWVEPVVSLRVFKSLKNSIGAWWKEYLQKDSLKGRG